MFESIMSQTQGILVGAVVGSLVSGTAAWVVAKINRAAANDMGTQMVLRFILVWADKHYTEQGWISNYDRETVIACWEAYEALGKNGVIHQSYENLMNLPNHPN